MKKSLLIAGLLCAFVSHADGNPVDRAEQQCLDGAATTLAIQQCYRTANLAWERDMNKAYADLMTRLNHAQKAKLRSAQRAWLKYRDGWLEASKVRLSDDGTLASVEVAAQEVNLVKNQTLALRSLAAAGCANPDDC
ncbi:lysozyme inhibitor LprI family protein [Pantoea sp. FN060301]|uniref:lysozyme inhibitor LprI family protein n=1 Tax=Pantoea sp. FN060301 TaxID=3420380 RepID=UPI003D176785